MSGRRKRGKGRNGKPQGNPPPSGAKQSGINHKDQSGNFRKGRPDGGAPKLTGQEQPTQADREQNTAKAVPSIVVPRANIHRPPVTTPTPKPSTKRYGLVFYDSIMGARNDLPRIREAAQAVDQLNIVIRAEPGPDEAELAAVGKVFCGSAWTLIHERRKADGWYDSPQE